MIHLKQEVGAKLKLKFNLLSGCREQGFLVCEQAQQIAPMDWAL